MITIGFAGYENGFMAAFNDFLAHEIRIPYTSKNGIIVSSGANMHTRLADKSFVPLVKFTDVNKIRLKRYNSDNVYITSYGNIVYNTGNNKLLMISTQNLSESGRNVTIIPTNVYYQLNLDRFDIKRDNNTVDLAMLCFLDFFERTNEPMCTSDMLFEDYVMSIQSEDQETMRDAYSAGYQVATEYISSLM